MIKKLLITLFLVFGLTITAHAKKEQKWVVRSKNIIKSRWLLYEGGSLVKEYIEDNNKGHGNNDSKCDPDNPGKKNNCNAIITEVIEESIVESDSTITFVPEIQDDWTVYTYTASGNRPTMIKRVVDPDGNGTVYDELSDGSYNVFEYDSDGKVNRIYNEIWDHYEEFIYNEDGNRIMTVSTVSWEEYSKDYDVYLDTYSNGKPMTHIQQDRNGNILVNRYSYDENGVQNGFDRYTEATPYEISLFKNYF